MKTVFTNGRIILADRILDGYSVIVEDGVISDVTRGNTAADKVINLGGRYLAPGFIDMHTHGAGGHDFMDGTEEAIKGACMTHLSHGTTSIVPTTLTCLNSELFNFFEVFRKVKTGWHEGPNLLGIHLEGPFFNAAQAGAQDPKFLQLPTRENFMPILEAGGADIMPIFDWTRTDLFHPVGDGSTALFYQKDMIRDDYKSMAEYILSFTEKYNMTFPGWEPERMAKLDELFAAYKDVTKEKLWDNLRYFLEALMPTCHETGIKMAIHMDDPPWDIFGLPRLLVDEASIDRFLKMVDDPYNCLTLCSGSLNANPENNVADIVRRHCDRIAFAHIRNIHHFDNGDFSEAAHRDCCGETGIIDILRAYHENDYQGYIRPDHGRQLWEEGPGTCRPGYGKYDRALGIQYMLGVWDLLDRLKEEKNNG